VIARNCSLEALDHQRRDLHSIKLSYLTEDRAASTIRGPVSCVLGMDRGFPHVSGGRCVMLRGASSPSGGRALSSSDCGIFQEVLEFALDTSPLGGGWLRHCSK
jgi:hypothetical protein